MLNLWSPICDLRFGDTWGSGMSSFGITSPISSPLTHMFYPLPFLSYLAGSKSASARPPVRHRYDDKFSSRSYHFVERQKYVSASLLCIAILTQSGFQFVGLHHFISSDQKFISDERSTTWVFPTNWWVSLSYSVVDLRRSRVTSNASWTFSCS